jgi:gamma-glutamylputrescine oxidase
MPASPSFAPGGAQPRRHADSYYAATITSTPNTPPLDGDAMIDHCIIGGGFAGLGAALALARAGQRVRLIEAGPLGWGASGRNGGQVHVGWQQDQDTLARRLGQDLARAMWQAALAARAHFDTLIALDADACDYRAGLIHADHRARDVAATHAHVATMRDRWGYASLTALDRDQLRALLASEDYHGGSLDSAGGHCHPLKLVHAIAGAAQQAGAVLHGATPCTALARAGDGWRVTTPRGTILAGQVLDATGACARALVPQAAARVLPIANYIATTAPLGAAGARALIANGAAVSDGRFVVYYFRTTPDHRLLFGGGETYGTTGPADVAGFVRPHLLRVFPQLADVPIDHAWGGLLAVSPDRLPFVIEPAPGLRALNGFSGLGVVLAPWLGDAVGQAMAGIANPGYDLLRRLPAPRFPGGPLLRWPTQVLAMRTLALLDKM